MEISDFDTVNLCILEICCHFYFEVNLTAILSNYFEFNVLFLSHKFSVEGFASWSDMVDGGFTQGLRTVVASGRQISLQGLQIHLYPMAQHWVWRDFCYVSYKVTCFKGSSLVFSRALLTMWWFFFILLLSHLICLYAPDKIYLFKIPLSLNCFFLRMFLSCLSSHFSHLNLIFNIYRY